MLTQAAINPEKIKKIITEVGYIQDQVYNVDGTAFFLQHKPARTIISQK